MGVLLSMDRLSASSRFAVILLLSQHVNVLLCDHVERGPALSTATILDRKTLETQLGLFIVIEIFTRLLPEQDRHATRVPAPPHSI